MNRWVALLCLGLMFLPNRGASDSVSVQEQCYRLVLAEEIEFAYTGKRYRPQNSRDIRAVIDETARWLPVYFPDGAFNMVDILTIAACESAFDRHAVGTKGEKGLFQILNYKILLAAAGGSDPFHPRINTRMGLMVLRNKYAKFRTKKRAIIAYNGVRKTPSGWDDRYWKRFQVVRQKIQACDDRAKVRITVMFKETQYAEAK